MPEETTPLHRKLHLVIYTISGIDSGMKDFRHRHKIAFGPTATGTKRQNEYYIGLDTYAELLWSLLVYDISFSTLDSIGAKICKSTGKGLEIPPGLIYVTEYCCKMKLRLLKMSTAEEKKRGKARLMAMLDESEDPAVRSFQP
ncbi:reverse transcriptase [Plakobranchus ocellatus]|uniref:Reverse transcriptase n=1 Tax=Plakobranchus ocellatus TaxID=259542 RepID=A0AAV4DT06_9GAST|nr:reverse transcriptase [Plakobranchus ocellatus]